MPQTSTRIGGVANVAVPTADHDRSIGFYVGTLGFEMRRDATFGPGLRWVEVAPPGASTTIALAPLPPGKSAGVDTGVRLTTSDAEALHGELEAQGVDVDDILRVPNVPPMFSFRDPEGNTLYIVQSA